MERTAICIDAKFGLTESKEYPIIPYNPNGRLRDNKTLIRIANDFGQVFDYPVRRFDIREINPADDAIKN